MYTRSYVDFSHADFMYLNLLSTLGALELTKPLRQE